MQNNSSHRRAKRVAEFLNKHFHAALLSHTMLKLASIQKIVHTALHAPVPRLCPDKTTRQVSQTAMHGYEPGLADLTNPTGSEWRLNELHSQVKLEGKESTVYTPGA
eukprot:6179188-Pleurochrysis_carterae.AAC.1